MIDHQPWHDRSMHGRASKCLFHSLSKTPPMCFHMGGVLATRSNGSVLKRESTSSSRNHRFPSDRTREPTSLVSTIQDETQVQWRPFPLHLRHAVSF